MLSTRGKEGIVIFMCVLYVQREKSRLFDNIPHKLCQDIT